MPSMLRRQRFPVRRHVIAAAAALLLGMPTLPAQAQVYSVSGNVYSAPVNAFPIDVNAPVLDLTGNQLFIGYGSAGSFSAGAGAQLSANALLLGGGAGSSFDVSGSGALVRLGGTGARLGIGDWGGGGLNAATVSVGGGAIVDATFNASACNGHWCGAFIANRAGAVGYLNIDGAGSEVRTLGNFYTAGTYADVNGGTAGGASNATIQVNNGGTLRTQNTILGVGGPSPLGNGTETSSTIITLWGAGSRWIVTPDQIAGGNANLVASNHALATTAIGLVFNSELMIDGNSSGTGANLTIGGQGNATLSLAAGGKVTVAANAAIGNAQSHMNIGQGLGSVGWVSVNGGELVLTGHVANLDVGGGFGATGTLDVLGGGRVSTGGLNIGANGGIGTVSVGNGSMIEINNGYYGRLSVGANGNGSLTVSNGGWVDATVNPGACLNGNCNNQLANGAGRTGALTIDGAGSEVRLLRGFGVANAGVDPGFGIPGGSASGTINITNGGTLRSQYTSLAQTCCGALGLGTEHSFADVVIDGVGSQWVVTHNSVDNWGVGFYAATTPRSTANITVRNGGLLRLDGSAGPGPYDVASLGSNGGQANLTIESGGQVVFTGPAVNPVNANRSANFVIGDSGAGTQAHAVVTGAGSELKVSGKSTGLLVGLSGGNGQLDVLNQGRVVSSIGGLSVGVQGGTGVVNVDNARMDLSGFDGRMLIGNAGTGTLTVSSGGVVDATLNAPGCIGNWCANIVANGAGSTGTLAITGAGSEVRTIRSFQAANVWVDNGFGVAGGTADAAISISNGGVLRTQATDLGIGAGGPLSNGLEQSITHVSIDGANSRWLIGANTVDGWNSTLNLSNHGRAQSFVELTNGAHLFVDGQSTAMGAGLTVGNNGGQATVNVLSGSQLWVWGGGSSSSSNNSYMNIGSGPASTGSVTVSGVGSLLYLDGNTGTLSVGAGTSASGTLLIENQGYASVGGLLIGNNGSTGSVTINNAGMDIFNGVNGRLNVGNAGFGTLTVTNGGLLDATAEPGHCIGVWCGNVVGFRAGSTGTLTVSGEGSELRTLRSFVVGDLNVDPYGGTPGGTSTGTINILAGGTLRTEGGVTLAGGPHGSLSLGTEKSFANVLLDGVGSQWIVTRNTVDNTGAATMAIAGAANATATVTVSNGGKLRIDGTGGPGPFDGIHIGSNGKGTLVLTGAGSALETTGVNPFINVGANTSAGNGSFQVLAGATASSLYMTVGRNGGAGSMLIDGSGSQVTLSGVGNAANPFTSWAWIGRNGGTGAVTVSDGGRLSINDGGMNSVGKGNPGFGLGQAANSHGSMTIDGPGSRVEVVSTSLGLPAGTPDNNNPFVGIGYDNPATSSGTLTVSNGGKLILIGNAVSTPTAGRATQLAIGGRNGTAATGTATVTGMGSEISLQGYDGLIVVGRTAGGNGTLNVLDHAKVSTTSMPVGASALGTVNIDNALIALDGYRTDGTNVGAGVTIGRGAGGNGVLNMTNGASLTITPSVLAGGMSAGGDPFASGGTGTVNLSGGSSITFGGGVPGNQLNIGRSGVGSMTLTGASLVDIGALAETRLGATVSGVGNLNVSDGSRFRTGIIGIGGHDESVVRGTGSAIFSGAGTELQAYGATGFIGVGFGGNGSLSITNQAALTGTLLAAGAGASGTGTVTLNNATVILGGQANDPNIAVAGAGLYLGGVGGVGAATIAGGTQVTITNTGSLGANLALGGFPSPGGALGTGTLNVSGASQVRLIADPGLAVARIGHDGTGTATFSGASLLEAAGGDVIIAGQPGSTGTLNLNSGSVLNADYVGVGSLRGGIDGGIGKLYINDSTVTATTIEIGTNSLLGGSNGIIHGNVIVRGTLSPGNSPGRITIDGGLRIDGPGRITIDVASNGGGGFDVDQLVLTQGSTYDLSTVVVNFNFIGNTDPNAFAATGGLDLDTFVKSADASGIETGLSTTFGPGSTWNSVLSQASFTATSNAYTVAVQLDNSGGGTFNIAAQPVPEPATWALWLAGAGLLSAWARRRRAVTAAPPAARRA